MVMQYSNKSSTEIVQHYSLRVLTIITLSMSLLIPSAVAEEKDASFFSNPSPFQKLMQWVRGDELTVEVNDKNTNNESADGNMNTEAAEQEQQLPGSKTSALEGAATDEEAPNSAQAPSTDGNPDSHANRPLNLSLPKGLFDDDTEFVLKEDRGIKMKNLFSAPTKAPSDDSTTSFGGRILMDDNFQQLEEYRINDVRDSIEGAELTFEVKTN